MSGPCRPTTPPTPRLTRARRGTGAPRPRADPKPFSSNALIDIDTDDAADAAAEASAAVSAACVPGLAIAVAVSTSMMTTIDGSQPGDS